MKKELLTKEFPTDLTVDQVYTAYNGKIGCMCGCQGDYAYASQHREYASSHRGYRVDDDEINDNRLRRRFNTIKNFIGTFIVGDHYVYIERNGRCFAIYFKK